MHVFMPQSHSIFWVSCRDFQVWQSSGIFFQSATHALCRRWYHHRVGKICPPTSLSLQALNQLWCLLGTTSPLKKQKTWVASRSPRVPRLPGFSQICTSLNLPEVCHVCDKNTSKPSTWVTLLAMLGYRKDWRHSNQRIDLPKKTRTTRI